MHKLLLNFIYSIVLRVFLKMIIGVQFEKYDFLKDEKQFIIVANHNSHLDTMTLLSAIPSNIIHMVRPVAAADHFGKSKLQGNLTRCFVNALLIPRKRNKQEPDKDPINIMTKALDDGYSLILFPEGTRGIPEIAQDLKPGVGLVLSQRDHIKYVPAHMTGLGKAMPKGDGLIIPYNSTLKMGVPRSIKNKSIDEIMEMIRTDFEELKST